jgi:hypothetical protein
MQCLPIAVRRFTWRRTPFFYNSLCCLARQPARFALVSVASHVASWRGCPAWRNSCIRCSISPSRRPARRGPSSTARRSTSIWCAFRANNTTISSPVDRAAEAAIIDIIRTAYPEHAILAEESGQSWADGEEQSEFTWVIDPLDGTAKTLSTAFRSAVSIPCQLGMPSLTVVYDPTRDELFTAGKGAGRS